MHTQDTTHPSTHPSSTTGQMPELPEVEALAAALRHECKGKRLRTLITKEQGGGPRDGLYDDLVFGKAEEDAVHRAMEGKVVVGVGRKGKHLWVEFGQSGAKGGGGGGKQCVLFHMGMTGSLLYRHTSTPQYRSFTLDAAQWPPKHCKAEFVFDGDIHLAFCDQRRWVGRFPPCGQPTPPPTFPTIHALQVGPRPPLAPRAGPAGRVAHQGLGPRRVEGIAGVARVSSPVASREQRPRQGGAAGSKQNCLGHRQLGT